jgi:rubredoxin
MQIAGCTCTPHVFGPDGMLHPTPDPAAKTDSNHRALHLPHCAGQEVEGTMTPAERATFAPRDGLCPMCGSTDLDIRERARSWSCRNCEWPYRFAPKVVA